MNDASVCMRKKSIRNYALACIIAFYYSRLILFLKKAIIHHFFLTSTYTVSGWIKWMRILIISFCATYLWFYIGINILSFLVSCHLNIKSILHRENARLIIKLNPKKKHTSTRLCTRFFFIIIHIQIFRFPHLPYRNIQEMKNILHIFFLFTLNMKIEI